MRRWDFYANIYSWIEPIELILEHLNLELNYEPAREPETTLKENK